MQIATNMCLDEIEGVDWGEPEYDSNLVVTCHKLRKKPVSEFELPQKESHRGSVNE